MFLKKKRIQHQSAKDGLEAVEKWKTGNFHLILVSHTPVWSTLPLLTAW